MKQIIDHFRTTLTTEQEEEFNSMLRTIIVIEALVAAIGVSTGLVLGLWLVDAGVFSQ